MFLFAAAASLLLVAACSAAPTMAPRDNEYPTLEFVGEEFSRVLIPALQTWNGSLVGLLVFERDDADDFTALLRAAANTYNAEPAESLSEDDSASIATYLASTLEPSVLDTFDHIVAQKPNYEESVVPQSVEQLVDTLGDDIVAYAQSLVRLVTADQTAAAQAATDKIQADATDAATAVAVS